MKERILSFLKQNSGRYVSGQEISDKLGVTRAAVWKHIKRLADEGYIIESAPRNGYKLIRCPDILTSDELILNTDFIGKKIIHYHSLGSTNTIARELAENGEPEGTVVVAEEQYAGKGRAGRKWFSQNRLGIWMSIVVRPDVPLRYVPVITQIACAAVGIIVKNISGNVQVKWPNDIYLNNKKICGILTQTSGETDRIDYIVLGIGINVNESLTDFPEEIREKASSLRLETGKILSRKQILCDVLEKFEMLYLEYKRSHSAAQAINFCRHNSFIIGRTIEAEIDNKIITAKAIDISNHGELILRTENGEILKAVSDSFRISDNIF